MPVYDADASLPALPIPALNVTTELIKDLAQPTASPEAWRETVDAAIALKSQGVRLQEALTDWRESLGGNCSWLRDYWDDSLLSARTPLPAAGTHALRLDTGDWGGQPLPAFILALCAFLRRAQREDLAVQKDGGEPLSMDTLGDLASSRLPGTVRDRRHRIAAGPARVAVNYRGRWFILTLSDAAGNLTTANAVSQTLEGIVRATDSLQVEPPAVGAATVAPRDEAAALRTRLEEFVGNRLALAALDDALFTVTLNTTVRGDGFINDVLCGDAAGRWYDKALQAVFGPDGEFGLCLDPTGADLGMWLYALGQVHADITGGALLGDPRIPVQVRSLSWRIDDGVRAELTHHREVHAARAAALSALSARVPEVRESVLLEKGRDPDVFVHLAAQAAYFRVTGEIAPAAAIVPVRRFYQGRTDLVRLATANAVSFVRALTEGAADEELQRLYAGAETEYRERLDQCRQGTGVENHLFGLRKMVETLARTPEPAAMPDLFATAGWLDAVRNAMIVEQAKGECVAGYGLFPYEADGVSVGTTFTVGGLDLTVAGCGKGTTASALVAAMRTALVQMLAVLGSV